MIWFGNLERILLGTEPGQDFQYSESRRMQLALERVAEVRPDLGGADLLDALAATGWVDRPAAERLLPHFRHFDPDLHFSDHIRQLSFRGNAAGEDFRNGIHQVVREITGNAARADLAGTGAVAFTEGDRQGLVLPFPEVGLTISGRTRTAVAAAAEQVPDALVLVARTFHPAATDQLRDALRRTDVPGTLVSVNLLLGIRGFAIRYQPPAHRIVDLLAHGGALRSAQVATLGERRAAGV